MDDAETQGREVMRRNSFTLALALASVCGLGLAAQESTTTTKTTVKGDEAKTVTYSGCLQSGVEAKSYVLAKVVPIQSSTRTEATGTSGTVTQTTTTTYALVPAEQQVEFQPLVGHKVEVTGMMIPAGDSKTETTTKTEVEHGPDQKTKETTKTENAMPQFRVTSIKQLAESCN